MPQLVKPATLSGTEVIAFRTDLAHVTSLAHIDANNGVTTMLGYHVPNPAFAL
jgi:hypothetical protein